jgi:serine O-acetyltransferase
LEKNFLHNLLQEHLQTKRCSSIKEISFWFEQLIGFLFPGFSDVYLTTDEEVNNFYNQLQQQLISILVCNDSQISANELVKDFFAQITNIKDKLEKDIEAIYQGDPAAKSKLEIVRSYPGFHAIAAHRVAHQLHKQNIEIIPRMLSEYAHTVTGIDIHPGATIGEYFFIDHGTGVVIGETSVIGKWVKIYQGVTLGALSVDKKDVYAQRHPTVEDNVVIYAGATILGGKTVVGKGSIVGGNVWLTRSIPPDSKVYYTASMSNENGEKDTLIFKA